jgi:ubiquinone/menaquinone biosynthesis C-methylase UbiE
MKKDPKERYNPEEVKKSNILYYNSVGWKDYDNRHMITRETLLNPHFLETVEQLLGLKFPQLDKVLDLGCGTGAMGLQLAQCAKVKDVYGIDISRMMLERALKNAEMLGRTFYVSAADCEHMPFPDASFDLIIGNAILHHTLRYRKILEETYRILKPDGIVLFAWEPTRVGASIIGLLRYLPEKVSQLLLRSVDNPLREKRLKEQLKRAPTDVLAFKPRDLHSELDEVGFREVRIRTLFFLRVIYDEVGRPFLTRMHLINPAIDRKTTRLLTILDIKVLNRLMPSICFMVLQFYARKPRTKKEFKPYR